ncbi:MAG: sugar ABC transporter permease [Lachnospiraceae bacterium]|nr:sugar ABC transporter permease [Lachnospiraceae bacterium]
MGKTIENSIAEGYRPEEKAGLAKSFIKGDIWTKLSALIMGTGCFARAQIARGLIFLAFQGLFIWYMITRGVYWISMLPSLGLVGPTKEYDAFFDTYVFTYNDNSFQILLYGILSLFLIAAFIFTWALNIKASYDAQVKDEQGKKVNKLKDDLRELLDEKFYKTLLTLPAIGITVFTFLPMVFTILIAFTNYDGSHDGYITNLFHWVGLENFKTMFTTSGNAGSGSYFATFMSILGWTLVWAFFATFSNYILGILVAMMINKKGIKFKKMWRTILVMTIAIPQFISLLYVSKMFAKSGIINNLLVNILHILDQPYDFWGSPMSARILVIVLNIWIGIPYLVLIATGILMNIPQDLYEASRIDGANPFQQFRYITMPYMLFVTAPYLLTSFTGNMNNFNVIYLLTGGGPINTAASSAAGSVGHTDLLITWLFKITQGTDSLYYMASVVGIAIFVIVSIITLTIYNRLGSNKNEGDMA